MSAGQRWLLATHNQGKLAELRQLLADLPVELVSLDAFPELESPEETGATFVDNALLKARFAHARTGLLSIADDSGIAIDALNGAPGVHSARFAGPDATDQQNNALMLARLDGLPPAERGARYVCAAVAVLGDGVELIAEGEVRGRLLEAPRGTGGFGYDPYFYYEPFGARSRRLRRPTRTASVTGERRFAS